jgi:ribosomal protein S18 acetylase RimI-like enzyme
LEFSIDNKTHEFKNVANYNQAMGLTANINDDAAASVCAELRAETAVHAETGLHAESAAQDAALRFVPVGEEAWDYCRALAQSNMEPYLVKRGQLWGRTAWDTMAPSREFFVLYAGQERIGFLSLWKDCDNNSIHIGDIQLEVFARNQGRGTRAIERVFAIAQSRGLREVTLNVFRDNPARNLYERLGFVVVDHGFDKLRMRRTLRLHDDAPRATTQGMQTSPTNSLAKEYRSNETATIVKLCVIARSATS